MKKILTAFLTLFFSLNFLVISQENSSLSQASWAFVQGTEAYKKGDWVSSITLFKKALSFKENDNADFHQFGRLKVKTANDQPTLCTALTRTNEQNQNQ